MPASTHSKVTPRIAAAFAALGLLATGCGSGEIQVKTETIELGSAETDTTTVATAAVPETTMAPTTEAPTTTVADNGEYALVQGGTLELGDTQGRNIGFWFWAPW